MYYFSQIIYGIGETNQNRGEKMTEENKNPELEESEVELTPEQQAEEDYKKKLEELRKRDPFVYR